MSGFGFDQDVLKTRVHGDRAREPCESFYLSVVKACWWAFVGVVLSCLLHCLNGKLHGNRKEKLMEHQPLTQQQQQQQQQQNQSSSRGAGKWRKKLLFIFVFTGVTGSIWLFWHLNNDIVFRRKETLANMCDERARMLQDQFNVSMNHVHALAILVSTFHHGKQPSAIDQVIFSSLPISFSLAQEFVNIKQFFI